jgi:hypothetical protein
VLRDAARPGSWVVVNKPVQSWGETAIWMTTARLWSVGLWRSEDRLQMTLEAISPDRRHWQHGCQRRWLEDAGVIEPLELIGEETRQQLDERLLRAVGMPELAMCPMWTPGGVAQKEAPVKKGRKRKAAPCQES